MDKQRRPMNNSLTIYDFLLTSPLLAIFLFSLVPITIKVLRGNKEQPYFATLLQGLIGLLACSALLIIFGGANKSAFFGSLVFDGITQWFGVIALLITCAALALFYDSPSLKGPHFSEIIFLLLNSVLGMLILVSANDFITMFIGLELMSLATYLLVALGHEEKFSKEAAIKYFILGGFASAIFLYGVALIYGSTGTTSIPSIVEKSTALLGSSQLFVFGTAFLLIGFCFKISIAPFHAWTPDVYQGAPTPLTSFMATAIKTVSFAALLRFIGTRVLADHVQIQDVLQWLAVITMIIGNVAAIVQNNFKRMLAYSSIAHSGYVLIGIITAGVSEQPSLASSSVVFYLFAYCIMTLGAFAIVSVLEKNENTTISVDNVAGLSKKHPWLALCLTIFCLSLAGIPPTLGFWGKFYLFSAAIKEGFLWLVLWGVINSVISVYYYLRPIVCMYMNEGSAELPQYALSTRFVISFCAVMIVLLGLVSGEIYKAAQHAFL